MIDEKLSNKSTWIVILILSVVSVFLGLDLQHIVDENHLSQNQSSINTQLPLEKQDSILAEPTTLAAFSITDNQG